MFKYLRIWNKAVWLLRHLQRDEAFSPFLPSILLMFVLQTFLKDHSILLLQSSTCSQPPVLTGSGKCQGIRGAMFTGWAVNLSPNRGPQPLPASCHSTHQCSRVPENLCCFSNIPRSFHLKAFAFSNLCLEHSLPRDPPGCPTHVTYDIYPNISFHEASLTIHWCPSALCRSSS